MVAEEIYERNLKLLKFPPVTSALPACQKQCSFSSNVIATNTSHQLSGTEFEDSECEHSFSFPHPSRPFTILRICPAHAQFFHCLWNCVHQLKWTAEHFSRTEDRVQVPEWPTLFSRKPQLQEAPDSAGPSDPHTFSVR